MSSETNINFKELIATYAAIGRQQRVYRRARLQRRSIFGIGMLAVTAFGIGTSLWQSQGGIGKELYLWNQAQLASIEVQLQQVQVLQASLATELEDIRRQRQELNEQRTALAVQKAAITEELTRVASDWQSIETQQQALEAQRQELASAVAASEQSWQKLASQRAQFDEQAPMIESELSEMTLARQQLAQQRREYTAQREQLEHELSTLAQRRAQLDRQRTELEAESQELQVVMEDVDERQRRLAPTVEDSEKPLSATESDLQIGGELTADELFAMTLAVVDDAELAATRGGFDIGGKLDIAIGLTRTVDINGVQQYASSVNISDLSRASAAELGSLQAIVVQNGAGNTVDAAALGANNGIMPIFIQNSLDNQHILNMNILDVTIGNTAGIAAGISADSAVADSLSFQR